MNTSPALSHKNGSALVMVLVVLLIVTAISTVSLKNSMHLMRLSQHQVWMEQAHFVAESGLEEAARVINTTPYMGAGVTRITHTLSGGQSADVIITPLSSEGQAFAVQSESTVNGITRQVNIGRIYRPTYLNYGNFYEDFRNLWWIYGEVIDGKVWTGTEQNIYGYTLRNGEKSGPVFNSLNETAANGFGGYPEYAATLSEGSDLSDFDYDELEFWDESSEGYSTNVGMPALLDIDFNRTYTIADALDVDPDLIDPSRVSVGNMPTGKALKLKGKTELRFSVDTIGGKEVGILEIRNKDKFGDYDWNAVYSEALDLIYVEYETGGNSKYRGADVELGESSSPNIVKANMTIWSEGDVTIPTHVIYNDQNLEESTDKLGVIAKDDVWFDRATSGDLVVQGGYIATGANSNSSYDRGELGLLDYNRYGVRGTLYFLGSMVAERVYPFGEFSGSRFVSGYVTDHRFDPRFLTDPPPFTPVISSQITYEGWF